MFFSFIIKVSCLILLKALLMSRYTTAVALVWSIACKIASVEDINEVSRDNIIAKHIIFHTFLEKPCDLGHDYQR